RKGAGAIAVAVGATAWCVRERSSGRAARGHRSGQWRSEYGGGLEFSGSTILLNSTPPPYSLLHCPERCSLAARALLLSLKHQAVALRAAGLVADHLVDFKDSRDLTHTPAINKPALAPDAMLIRNAGFATDQNSSALLSEN